MKILAIAEPTPQAALESVVDTIALEAMTMSGVFNRVADLVPTLVQSAKNFFATNPDKPELPALHLNEAVLSKCFDNAPYSDIVSLSHPVPAGFEGNLYEYAKVLEQQVHYINELPAKLTAFNQFVSGLITNAQSRKSVQNTSDDYRKMAESRKELLQASRSFFPSAHSRIAQRRYGDIVASNNQYLELSRFVVTIVAEANKTTFKDTQKLIADCKELLDALSHSAAGGQLTEMSGASMETLATYTETIAHEAEMYAVVLFAVAELRKCIEQGNKKLIQALRY